MPLYEFVVLITMLTCMHVLAMTHRKGGEQSQLYDGVIPCNISLQILPLITGECWDRCELVCSPESPKPLVHTDTNTMCH
jgi:hypothetical protein